MSTEEIGSTVVVVRVVLIDGSTDLLLAPHQTDDGQDQQTAE